MRVPQFAVRLVMLAVLFLLTGVVAQVAPAAAAVRTGSPGTAASLAVSGYLSDVAATSASNAWAVGYNQCSDAADTGDPSTSCVFSGGRATANSVLVRDALTMPR